MHMGSPLQMLLIAVVVLVLFGRGKISGMMGEMGKGISAFKKGIKDSAEEDEAAKIDAARDVTPPPVAPPVAPVASTENKDKV